MARPTKAFNERRGEQINLRVTAEERAQLEQTATNLGLPIGEFLRRRGLGYRLPKDAATAQAHAVTAAALVRLGNNLNQIAKHMNAGRAGGSAELTALLGRITHELDKLYGPGADDRRPVL